QCGQNAQSYERHDGRPASAPFPGTLPRGYRPRENRIAVDKPAQVVRKRAGCGEPPCGLFLQAFQANRLEIMRNAWLELARRYRLLFAELTDGVERIPGLEGRPADKQLVEDRAQ